MRCNTDRRSSVRSLCIAAAMFAGAGCASIGSDPEYAAHGYLSPGPTSQSELIGVYTSRDECEAAADAWASRQVVGNPVYAECYPVDTN